MHLDEKEWNTRGGECDGNVEHEGEGCERGHRENVTGHYITALIKKMKAFN